MTKVVTSQTRQREEGHPTYQQGATRMWIIQEYSVTFEVQQEAMGINKVWTTRMTAMTTLKFIRFPVMSEDT